MEFQIAKLRKDIIKKRLIDNDMTMDQAAAEIGISKATLSRLEHSKRPDVDTLAKVCDWLDQEPNTYFKIYPKNNITPQRHRND